MKFKYGDKVKITNTSLKTYGFKGIVLSYYGNNSCWVKLSTGDILCYKEKNLTLMSDNDEEENETMVITGDFNVVKIKFLDSYSTAEYEYASFEDNLEVGDIVVVASANHGLGLAKITALIERDQAKIKNFEREIVSKVDMETYNQRREKRIKAADLKNRMDQRVQELNKLAIFEMMAEKDDSLKEMLEEYKALVG